MPIVPRCTCPTCDGDPSFPITSNRRVLRAWRRAIRALPVNNGGVHSTTYPALVQRARVESDAHDFRLLMRRGAQISAYVVPTGEVLRLITPN